MPVCAIAWKCRGGACGGDRTHSPRAEKAANASSAVLHSSSCEAIHESLSTAQSICRASRNGHTFDVDQHCNVREAVPMKLTNRQSALPYSKDEYERL
jgi:hypothetical protein